MKNFNILIIFTLMFAVTNTFAQVGIGTDTPDSTSVLDLTSTTQGFLPPRMTKVQRDAISSPAEGLVVYNTDEHCLNFWNGSLWMSACGTDNTILNNCGAETVSFVYNGNNVTYGIVYNSTTGKCWLDRNLGAAQVATTSDDASSFGDLFQWGRGADGHQLRTSSITNVISASDTPGHGDFIKSTNAVEWDWRNPHNDNLWQGGTGVNNPCPSGFRLPTLQEITAGKNSWSSQDAAGAFGSVLKLPASGLRTPKGALSSAKNAYWTSTVFGQKSAQRLEFTNSTAVVNWGNRGFGAAVRCIKN